MKSFNFQEKVFLSRFIKVLEKENIPVRIVDTRGESYSTAQNDVRHELYIRDKKFFKALASPNAFTMGEAYINGYFDVSGSMMELYDRVCHVLLDKRQRIGLIRSVFKWLNQSRKRETEKNNIGYHYDVPAKFYQSFLGRTMGYTCGYYADESAAMDDAQMEKMDIICRKLRLKKQDRVLDIGCGWGNFAVFAAKHYGAHVHGITLSAEQKKHADHWIEKEGLGRNVSIRMMNYRDLNRDHLYDKISCVGMSEHVGRQNMPVFFKKVFQSLKPGGLFLVHTITTNRRHTKHRENSFLDRYMFPGGELMNEPELVSTADACGFELLNAENFRPHYIKTLDDWISEMEKNKKKILDIVSRKIYRIYYVFFIGSLISFRNKEISLFQNLFYKPGSDGDSSRYFISPYSKNEKRFS